MRIIDTVLSSNPTFPSTVQIGHGDGSPSVDLHADGTWSGAGPDAVEDALRRMTGPLGGIPEIMLWLLIREMRRDLADPE